MMERVSICIFEYRMHVHIILLNNDMFDYADYAY